MIMRALLSSLVFSVACAGAAVRAHPHVFVDAGFELLFDAKGQLSAVRIDWAYDEFYSLMLIEENGLDNDGDGTPEQAALDAYAGHDVDWAAGFPGDFDLEQGGEAVVLDGPVMHRARFEQGRVVTSHVRPLAAPLDMTDGAVIARAYDPSYFVAYDVPVAPAISGRTGCTLDREAVDYGAAEAEYADRLAAIDATSDPFEQVDLPDIGVMFADRFVLTCAPFS
ncbi:hypothetical protein Lokhon_02156 [Limimaricola hongkongensis DSM 17492]|uniref:Polyphosphate kinase n=2 Tax=Limimaricola hongkongensis TaxID=278132 RepID=A0A017HE90_9RHOB|nr:hypothetical protein Lokhon_02156 [Limimaricola hongkongensis DSM 17492]